MKENEAIEDDISFDIVSFPIRTSKELSIYNIYHNDPNDGLSQSIILEEPAIRQGCTTTCYFDALKTSIQTYKEPCTSCGNESKKFLLDVGFKIFLQKVEQYVLVHKPIHIEINPNNQEYYFPSTANSLLGQFSYYIGEKIYRDLSLSQTPAMNSSILDFKAINNILEGIMQPTTKKTSSSLYSFCKYILNNQDQKDYNWILLFFQYPSEPIKAKILNENGQNICEVKQYGSKECMINFLGKINTLFVAVCTNERTQYYVSQINHHFNLESETLTMVKLQHHDASPRIDGFLLADQNNDCMFAIGGYDHRRNEALDYITCFLYCKWEQKNQRNEFKCEFKKDHPMFQIKTGISSTQSIAKSDSKIILKNSTYLLYQFNREIQMERQKKMRQKKEPVSKKIYSIGGYIRDPANNSTGRFTNTQPGLRQIDYNPSFRRHPIIPNNYTQNQQIAFLNHNYIACEIPHINTEKEKKKYLSHCLVFGGTSLSKQSKTNQQPNSVYILDMNKTEKNKALGERFEFGKLLTDITDNYSVLLHNEKEKENFMRMTVPLKVPVQTKDKKGFIHYIAIEFGLENGLFAVYPGFIESWH